jgi:hypothetical protein
VVSKSGMANFLHALAAVLAGNVVYFLLLPHLPSTLRHVTLHVDLGMAVDFWLCLVALGVIKTIVWWKQESASRD